MGCGGSRLDGNGAVLPPRLRPLHVLRPEEIKTRRHGRTSSTTSKIMLLLHETDIEDQNSSSPKEDNVIIFGRKYDEKGPGKPEEEVCEENEQVKEGNIIKNMNIKEEFDDALADAYNNEDDDDDDGDGDDDDKDEDEDERMIGHDEMGAFPGSPTFRVYFKDDGEYKHEDLGKMKNNGFKSTISIDDDHTVLSKEPSDQNIKKVKRGRKNKSFRKVLPKGGQAAVKNLLSVKSRYSPSPSAKHHRRHHSLHLLTGKTSA